MRSGFIGVIVGRSRHGVGLHAFIVMGTVAMWAIAMDQAHAIDVKLTMEEAKKALAAGRGPMEKANTPEEVKKVLLQASVNTRIGADPEKDSCGTSAILRTKRFWLESFGRKEATESKKQKQEIHMPDDKIQKYLDMPNLEMEVQAEKGRKNEGQGPAYRSRFTARFAYDSFDPNAKTKVMVIFPDGKLSEFEADFSKIK